MDAILHVGVTKTGTTTIQKFLRENCEILGRQGIFVPRSIMFPNDFGQHTGLSAISASRAGNDYATKWLSRALVPAGADRGEGLERLHDLFVQEVRDAGQHRKAIISTEAMSHLGRAEFVEAHGILSRLFDRIKVLIYLRRQDLHAVSLFNSMVRIQVPVLDLFPDPPYPHHDFARMASDLAESFGRANVEVRLFERASLEGGDSLGDFRLACGIVDDPSFFIPERQNESLNAKQVAFIHHLQCANGENTLPPMQLRAILDELECEERFMPSRAAAEAYYRQFAAGNALVAREFLGRDGPLFDEDFGMYPESAAIGDFITVEDMARAMIRHLNVERRIRIRKRKAKARN